MGSEEDSGAAVAQAAHPVPHPGAGPAGRDRSWPRPGTPGRGGGSARAPDRGGGAGRRSRCPSGGRPRRRARMLQAGFVCARASAAESPYRRPCKHQLRPTAQREGGAAALARWPMRSRTRCGSRRKAQRDTAAGPPLGGSSVASMRSVGVLPSPLGPRKPKISPRGRADRRRPPRRFRPCRRTIPTASPLFQWLLELMLIIFIIQCKNLMHALKMC
jgi:hypothetical protein